MDKRLLLVTVGMSTTVLLGQVSTVFASTQGPDQMPSQVSSTKSANSQIGANSLYTPQTTWLYEVGWQKSYQDIYGITIATQVAYTEWYSNGSYNTGKGPLWQDDSINLGTYSNVSNSWNYFYSGVGESNELVEFKTQIPIPWGSITVSDWTSRIVTDVYPSGSSSAY